MLAMSNTEDPSNWVIDWAVHARNHFSHPSEQPVYPGNPSQSMGDSQGPSYPPQDRMSVIPSTVFQGFHPNASTSTDL